MPSDPLLPNDIIASRELRVVGSDEKVLVEIGKPRQRDDDVHCPYRIHYQGRVLGRGMFGIDGFQALQLAMKTLPVELRHNSQLPVGRMYQFEPGDDMGFPEVKEPE